MISMNSCLKTYQQHHGYVVATLKSYQRLNAKIISSYHSNKETPDKQTHYLHNRFENTYINVDRIRQLDQLLSNAYGIAANILDVETSALKQGFWFNEMQPSHVTSCHNHDEDDELLSAVYYLDVPKNSGDLILYIDDANTVITPKPGMFVFFAPSLEHEVTRNNSTETRLSLAMNFGLKE